MTSKRSKTFNMNKYQTRIVLTTFFPLLFICAIVVLFLQAFFSEILQVITTWSAAKTTRLILQWNVAFYAIYVLLLLGVLFWAYYVSRDIVGAFERILKDLDAVIDGEQRKPITARAKDELANELLKRINILIRNLPDSPKKLK